MNDVIADREFEWSTQDKKYVKLKVTIYKPYPVSGDQNSWRCKWKVQQPDKTVERYAGGVDSLQALRIGMEMLKIEIESFTMQYKGVLTFLHQDRLWL